MLSPDPPSGTEATSTFQNTDHFKRVLQGVITITVITLITSIALSVFAENPNSASMIKAIDRTWQAFLMGFAALIGLIGGKSA